MEAGFRKMGNLGIRVGEDLKRASGNGGKRESEKMRVACLGRPRHPKQPGSILIGTLPFWKPGSDTSLSAR